MSLKRTLRHLATTPWQVRRAFSPATLAAIEAAVRACESQHAGEIRFAVEGALSLHQLWRGMTPRERAVEIFSTLRVWDTEHNNGVRSEEHTSELQSLMRISYAVFCLKKKKKR